MDSKGDESPPVGSVMDNFLSGFKNVEYGNNIGMGWFTNEKKKRYIGKDDDKGPKFSSSVPLGSAISDFSNNSNQGSNKCHIHQNEMNEIDTEIVVSSVETPNTVVSRMSESDIQAKIKRLKARKSDSELDDKNFSRSKTVSAEPRQR
ncbi:hypothetical protein HK096_001273, partial [Nowakowskiella sp. JEL0078]